MGDVDKLQEAEEEVAQREQEERRQDREREAAELAAEPIKETATRTRRGEKVRIDHLQTIPNIRTELGDIHELALSIRQRGLIAPLVVRETDEEGNYEIIAGRRRYEALRRLHDGAPETEIPCEVIEEVTDAETYELMLLENVQRQQLSELEEGRALRQLLDLNPDLHAGDLAHSLGKSSSWASSRLRLLDLPKDILKMIDRGDLSFTVADMLRRAQSTDKISAEEVEEIAEEAASGKLTSKQVRARIRPMTSQETEEILGNNAGFQAGSERIEADELVLTAEDAEIEEVETSLALREETPPAEESRRRGPTPRQLELYAIERLARLIPEKERGPIAIPQDKHLEEWTKEISNEDIGDVRLKIARALYKD